VSVDPCRVVVLGVVCLHVSLYTVAKEFFGDVEPTKLFLLLREIIPHVDIIPQLKEKA